MQIPALRSPGAPTPAGPARSSVDLVAPGGPAAVPETLRAPLGPLLRADAPLLAALAGVIVLAYVAVLARNYAFVDDWLLLQEGLTRSEQIFDHSIATGRPLSALIGAAVTAASPDVGDLRWLRLVGVLGIAGVGVVVALLLRSTGVRRPRALATAAVVCALPAYQVVAAWASLFVAPLAVLLALGAGLLLPDRLGRRTLARAALALLLLVSSMTIYQPAAMCFWLVPLAVVLERRLRDRRQVLLAALSFGAVFTAAAVAGLVALKVGTAVEGVPGNRGVITVSLLGEKLHWFLLEAVPRSLTPFFVAPHPKRAVLTLGLMLVGLWVHLGRPKAPWWGGAERFLRVSAAFLLLAVAYLPSLTTAENWASSRSMVALMPAAALIGGAAAHGFGLLVARALPHTPPRALATAGAAALALGAVAALALAGWKADTYFARPQSVELAAARGAVARLDADRPITVVPSHYSQTIAPGLSYDEYGLPSTAQEFVPVALTDVLLAELTGRLPRQVLLVPRGTPLPGGNGVDFGELMARLSGTPATR